MNILIVEDEAISANMLKMLMERRGHHVVGPVATGEEAVEMALTRGPDVILMDIHLAGEMDGIDAVGAIQKENPIPVIFITAYDETSVVDRAMKHNPLAYLKKPVNPNEIEKILRDSF